MSQKTEKLTVNVQGMHCASCAATISRRLEKIAGVESCVVNYGTETAKIDFNPEKVRVTDMNQELAKVGYSLSPATHHHDHSIQGAGSLHQGHDLMTPISSDSSIKDQKLKELATLKQQLKILMPFVAISFVMMVWEIGATPLNLWPTMPEIVSVFLHHLLPIMATYTLFVIGLPYLKAVGRFAQHRVANMDTLVGIGTLVAFGYSFFLSAFETTLAPFINTEQIYYDVTIVVIGFITLGKYLESKSKLKTGEAIEKLLNLQVKTASVIRDGQEIEVPIEEVVVGDVFLVKPGQKIPTDGTILTGTTTINESMITGESLPVDKKEGDEVIGATVNQQGSLTVKASRIGSQTVLAQIISLVEEAQGSKAPIERIADQVSAVFVPTVLVLAILVLFAWITVGPFFLPLAESVKIGILSFVGILVIACPCAMGLATPTAVIVGVGKAAQHGILIKNAENLEKFNSIDFMVMDKTGTLTNGRPVVTDIQVMPGLSESKLLKIVASLEAKSEHPLAQAIVSRAKQARVSLSSVEKFSALEGQGLTGSIDRQVYYVGNVSLARQLSLKVDTDFIDAVSQQGKTPVIVMTEKKILGYVALADTVKTEAKEVIEELHRLKIKIAMLTGDNLQTATYIAQQLGIDRVVAEVLPADKAREIRKIKAEGYQVAMIGDGINDAPALVSADVGVAMGTGTDVAIESAGITLLGGRLRKLPQAVILARATMLNIKQNLFWAFFYNVVGIPIAAGILYPVWGVLLSPALAGGAMAFSSVSVVLNALRLKAVKL